MRLLIISGPTGSGKTSLSNQISNKIENSYILSTDNYYKTGIISKFLSRVIKVYFDRKISFNYRLFKKDFEYIIKNERINHVYSYDFKNKKLNKYLHKKENINLLIIEGIFAGELFNDYKKRNYSFVVDILSLINVKTANGQLPTLIAIRRLMEQLVMI